MERSEMIGEVLLSRLPRPANLAVYQEEVKSLLAANEKKLRQNKGTVIGAGRCINVNHGFQGAGWYAPYQANVIDKRDLYSHWLDLPHDAKRRDWFRQWG